MYKVAKITENFVFQSLHGNKFRYIESTMEKFFRFELRVIEFYVRLNEFNLTLKTVGKH